MAKPLSFDQTRRQAEKELSAAGVETPVIDVKLMLRTAADFSAAQLIGEGSSPIPLDILARFREMVQRRAHHEPVAYILGHQAFWSLDFYITNDVLIPRPETEGVVERALDLIKECGAPRILDVGAGSGAILISLLHERKDAMGVTVDISETALAVARENADRIGVTDRMRAVTSDFTKEIKGCFDLIVSNPPYITETAMRELPETVDKFEPHLALRGGVNGLDAYHRIIDDLPRLLRPNGIVVFEIGYDQADAVMDLLAKRGLVEIGLDQDLAGLDRVVFAKKNCA